MDPDIAYERFLVHDGAERREAAEALIDWLEKGGYVPSELAALLRESGIPSRDHRSAAVNYLAWQLNRMED